MIKFNSKFIVKTIKTIQFGLNAVLGELVIFQFSCYPKNYTPLASARLCHSDGPLVRGEFGQCKFENLEHFITMPQRNSKKHINAFPLGTGTVTSRQNCEGKQLLTFNL
jgi:hypothetical protein